MQLLFYYTIILHLSAMEKVRVGGDNSAHFLRLYAILEKTIVLKDEKVC